MSRSAGSDCNEKILGACHRHIEEFQSYLLGGGGDIDLSHVDVSDAMLAPPAFPNEYIVPPYPQSDSFPSIVSAGNQPVPLSTEAFHLNCRYCGVLLEVSIPSSHRSSLITVRCGSCTSLLAVSVSPSSMEFPSKYTQPAGGSSQSEVTASNGLQAGGGDPLSPSPCCAASASRGSAGGGGDNRFNHPPGKRCKDCSCAPTAGMGGKTSTVPKRTRAPSPYNLFIRDEIPRVKARDPGLDHREAFKLAAKNWANSSQNVRSGESAGAKFMFDNNLFRGGNLSATVDKQRSAEWP